MGDGAIRPDAMLGTMSDETYDLGTLMDDLFDDGFWLETTDGYDSWHRLLSSSSTALDSPSYCFPSSEIGPSSSSRNQRYPEETEQLNLGDKSSILPPPMDEFAQNQAPKQDATPPVPSSTLSESFLVQGTETNTRLWIEPDRNPSPTKSSAKKKLLEAIEYLKESTREKDVLIQIWVPIKRGGRRVLTTNNQPFVLDQNCKSLAEYRDVSRKFQFPAEQDSKEPAGLPGRVFLKKSPEWTPDVRFFRKEEYPRVSHAREHNVRGSFALPVFERGSGTCLGVVEIVTTSQKVNCRPELENVCRALEAVDLRSSDISTSPKPNEGNESYQAALGEIKDVLKFVCDTHELPLAQTWAPCVQQGKGGCWHSQENYASCVSTIDSACYVRDSQVWDFHEACSDHHLLKGEGVAGGAFITNQPCFATDVTAFSKTEYPLSHHARMFGLCAAVAIRLRSMYTGSADFVLEFFLPSNCRALEDQKHMLHSLSAVIQQICRTLRVVSDGELAEETVIPAAEMVSASIGGSDEGNSPKRYSPPLGKPCQEAPFSLAAGYCTNEQKGEFRLSTEWEENPEVELRHLTSSPGYNQIQLDSGNKDGRLCSEDYTSIIQSHSKKSGERRRTKTEKTISLQVLRQYFAGSLKDAAKSIGVCPTTLKRICRQHGITRWPSRKIKKVGHSLKKLQLVIDSVQGAEGAIQLSSFYNNFPELNSPNLPAGPSDCNTLGPTDHIPQMNTQAEGSILSPGTTDSKSPSSSCSHSSSSSLCCSNGLKQSPLIGHASNTGVSLSGLPPGALIKRTRSDADLHDLGHVETKILLRSQSQNILTDHAPVEALCPIPKVNSEQILRAPTVTAFRVKATLGEEKIRLSLLAQWSFIDLRREVLRRFGMEETRKIDLKYLDDDSEWVLLTCDADLEECIDIHISSRSRTIKLSLHQASRSNIGSSFGSSGP